MLFFLIRTQETFFNFILNYHFKHFTALAGMVFIFKKLNDFDVNFVNSFHIEETFQ